jgi:hypothetical protein
LIEEEASLGQMLRQATILGGHQGNAEQRSSSSQLHYRRIALGLAASDVVCAIGALSTVQVLRGGWLVLPLRLLMRLNLVPVLWGAVFLVFGLYELNRASERDALARKR